jgi:hypothetical protein
MLGQLGRLNFAAEASSASSAARGGFASGQRFWSANNSRSGPNQPQFSTRPSHGKLSLHAAAVLAESETRNFSSSNKRHNQPELQVGFLFRESILYFSLNRVDVSKCIFSDLEISSFAVLSRFP